MTLADMLDKLERGQIGHAAAMRWLGTESLNELVATVHANGRQMPGHRPTHVPPETLAILRQALRKPPPTNPESQAVEHPAPRAAPARH